MDRAGVSFDDVREAARALPGVEASGIRGSPSLKARGKLLACPAIHKSAEPRSLVVKLGFDQRAELIAKHPGVFYITDHYVGYPSVLVRLARIDRGSLKSLLFDAWQFVAGRTRAPRRCPKGHLYYKSSACPVCPKCEALRAPTDGFMAGLRFRRTPLRKPRAG